MCAMSSGRVLLVADDVFDSPAAVPACMRDALRASDSVHVVAPIITSHVGVLMDDEAAHEAARARAHTVVERLRDQGIAADGEASDAGPFDAIVTAFLDADFDRVIVGSTEHGHWREKGLLERLHEQVAVPVMNVVVTH